MKLVSDNYAENECLQFMSLYAQRIGISCKPIPYSEAYPFTLLNEKNIDTLVPPEIADADRENFMAYAGKKLGEGLLGNLRTSFEKLHQEYKKLAILHVRKEDDHGTRMFGFAITTDYLLEHLRGEQSVDDFMSEYTSDESREIFVQVGLDNQIRYITGDCWYYDHQTLENVLSEVRILRLAGFSEKEIEIELASRQIECEYKQRSDNLRKYDIKELKVIKEAWRLVL